MSELKAMVAKAALAYLGDDQVIGIGTGSTTSYFIRALATVKHRIDACVASSSVSERQLKEAGLRVIDLNAAGEVPLYFDGADEVNERREMIKGGGGALTREKIIASVAKQFICMVDGAKWVRRLGTFPIAVEVIPMARSAVARELVKLGGDPVYREGFITDNGNIILDVYRLCTDEPIALEDAINGITGVVEHGLFAKRRADCVLVARQTGVTSF